VASAKMASNLPIPPKKADTADVDTIGTSLHETQSGCKLCISSTSRLHGTPMGASNRPHLPLTASIPYGLDRFYYL